LSTAAAASIATTNQRKRGQRCPGVAAIISPRAGPSLPRLYPLDS
jgi:hypothetical protein